MSDALIVQPKALLTRAIVGFSSGLPFGGILDQTGKEATDPATKALVGAIPMRGESPAQYQRNGTSVRVRGFEQHPVVSACVREIVNILAAIPFEVYRKMGNTKSGKPKVEILPQHPAQLLLDAPSSFISAQRLRGLLATHFTVYGNGLWFLERPEPSVPGGTPLPPYGLRIVQPEDLMTVYVNNRGYPLAYLWRDYLGYMHTSPAIDLVHFRDLDAKGLVFGYPRAASALNDIIGDNEASQYTREVVTNSGWAGMVMLMAEESNPSDALIAQAAWEEKMTTRGGRGKTAWVGGVKDVKPMGFNLRDLEFPDLRRVTREDICAAFGVDPRMIGITSAARDAGLSGQQYSEARRRLIQQTIEPMMRAFESEMNLWLMPEFGDVWVRFSPEALQSLVEDDAETSTRIQGEVKSQLRSIEEGRTALGMEGDFNQKDHLLISGQGTAMVTVAVALAGAEFTPGTPLDENGKPKPPEPKPPVVDPKTGQPVATPPKGGKKSDLSNVLTRGIVLMPEQRRLLWAEFDTRARKDENAYKRQAAMLFADERESVSRIFAHQIAAAKAAGVERAAADAGTANPHGAEAHYIDAVRKQTRQMYKASGDVVHRWKDRFRPLIQSTYADGGASITKRLKSRAAAAAELRDGTTPIAFDLHNPKVQEAIAERARRLSELVGKTTGQNITDAIALGESEGMTLAEIASLIDKTTFGGDAAYRSLMIARTETIGALNQGEFDTALGSEIVQQKEWLTQNDERVRDSHAECEDEGRIDIDELFESTAMMFPGDAAGDAGDVINCRCTLLYYDDGGKGGDGAGDEGGN